MSDYLYQDHEEPKLDHPDSAIRLACVVHRFRVPKMVKGRKVSLARAFSTVGRDPKTRRFMLNADDARNRLDEATQAKKISSERVIQDAKRYIPMIDAILLSCKVQPESARLDEKLVFEWMSGIEGKPDGFQSEAIMYDLTMAIVCEGLGHAAGATENSVMGEFAAASREYALAAGVFDFLSSEHLPKWISKGSKVNDDTLPSECHAPCAKALKMLFMANGQQMAVATLLIKEGKPNFSLLSKLCFGIHEQLEDFVSLMRKEAFNQMSRMDKDFFSLITFQINVQKCLSLYFQARNLWEKQEYGIAIAIMSEATVALRTRADEASHGVPDISRIPALCALKNDLQDLRAHMNLVLKTWEKDNSSVYFSAVPTHVPAEKKLQEGVKMNKAVAFKLEDVEPLLLVVPEGDLQRSDSDLARELQERMNAGDDE